MANSQRAILEWPNPELTSKLYRAMIALAEDCIEIGHTQTACDILAFLLLQKELSGAAFARADALFAELESRVCPRVILDAREFAADLDLQGMVEYLLDIAPRERI
ncbi:MAG: hypothetical protein OXI77_18140 [Chloroflexota bacterium]|nr:hypothetical protein [Chloroflexota bacterium]MDE2908307.1 hypothetical protein [Chloroflexota bacterium]